ncbi:MAG: PEP-CTERM sorting domain-containing protein [Chlamydiales bacterium]|nr:PEP-CTERM sorting domain-containing protein [Chlamydiales bacterium]
MLRNNVSAMLLGVAFLFASSANAVDVNPGDFTGSRTTPNGVTGTGPWGNTPGYKVSWNITQTGNVFHYAYDITVPSKNISHTILELSDNINKDNISSLIYNFKVNGSSKSTPTPTLFKPTDPGNSNPGLPGGIYGIKIDMTSTTQKVTFDSLRAPMWGDIYSKDGVSSGQFVYAFNKGFGLDPTGSDFSKWIAVPDTKQIKVPEPATYLLMLSGLTLAAFKLRSKRNQKLVNRSWIAGEQASW